MQTSPDLPTTVDFGNNLVNYIEVSPEEALKQPLTAAEKKAAAAAAELAAELPKVPRTKLVLPPEMYQKDIPQYLLDFDQSEDSPAYQSAIGAIEKLPTPPSLPGFLSKPILNAATLMKDDNSVLNMPNHTVLNHLATSSIKNNVLAVSATTRYRSKVCPQTLYKFETTANLVLVCHHHHLQAHVCRRGLNLCRRWRDLETRVPTWQPTHVCSYYALVRHVLFIKFSC